MSDKEESADAIYTWLQEYEAPRLELVVELLERNGWLHESDTYSPEEIRAQKLKEIAKDHHELLKSLEDK